ncbi:hypothetical protein DFH28DRAFT_1110511 [Melampsora americana]|nr:hypothetical protein DFH28DRAFT_1110511 [Melampsora americana]
MPEDQSSYIHQVPQWSTNHPPNQIESDSSTTIAPPIVVNIANSQLMHHFLGFPKHKPDKLHKILLFQFLHNPYFCLYQENSVYGVILLWGTSMKYYLDNLDLHTAQHTSQNVLKSTSGVLCQQGVDWETVCALFTDSPAIMVKFGVAVKVFLTRVNWRSTQVS